MPFKMTQVGGNVQKCLFSSTIRRLMDNTKLLLICILRVLLAYSLALCFIDVYMGLFLFDNVTYVFF